MISDFSHTEKQNLVINQ
uniref:Uncharacterized protein n=1 Tax=Arundo donax TaxID=35708 RepID=A0A0A9BWT2_ARUDO